MIKSTDFIIVDIHEVSSSKIDVQELIRKKLEDLQSGSWDIKQIINIESTEENMTLNGLITYFCEIKLYLLMELKHE